MTRLVLALAVAAVSLACDPPRATAPTPVPLVTTRPLAPTGAITPIPIPCPFTSDPRVRPLWDPCAKAPRP